MSNNEKHCHDHGCVDFNETATVGDATSTVDTGTIAPFNPDQLIRVPVSLGNVNVTTTLSANIHFKDPVLEIKDIKKRVKIVQCRLMTPSVAADAPDSARFSTGPFTLIIRGFVRKNIQYATPNRHDSHGECISSDLRSLTTDVPFQLMTTVTTLNPVELPVAGARTEFDFFRAQPLGMGFPEKDHLLSSDLSQFHQTSRQFYNQLPFCELVSSEIIEWDEATDRTHLPGDHGHHGHHGHRGGAIEEGYFHNIVEKMMLTFTVRVMQNQTVRVAGL